MLCKLLSVSTPYAFNQLKKKRLHGLRVTDIAASIDRLRIMTYDYPLLAWTDWTDCLDGKNFANQCHAASKVFIGLPRLWARLDNGHLWNLSSICATRPDYVGKGGNIQMNYANAKAVIDQATPVFDEKNSEVTYSYIKTFNGLTAKGAATTCNVSRTVWYQNDRSYSERMNLVAKYRLGGAALDTGMEDQVQLCLCET